MNKAGIQLYTIRDWFDTEEHTVEAFKRLAEIGYTQAQTAGLYSYMTPEKFAAAAKENGIEFVGTHYDFDMMKNDLEGTIKYHEILGTRNVGIGGMPKEARESKEELLKFIDQANEVAAKLAARGYKFTYHNHSFEFKKIDGKTIFDYLIEGFDKDNITFVLDTYWLQHGGVDIRRMLERLDGRVDILHLKDMGACGENRAPYITDVGNGNIDFKDIVACAEEHGVKYFVVEQDGNYAVDSITSAKSCFDYLKANVMK